MPKLAIRMVAARRAEKTVVHKVPFAGLRHIGYSRALAAVDQRTVVKSVAGPPTAQPSLLRGVTSVIRCNSPVAIVLESPSLISL